MKNIYLKGLVLCAAICLVFTLGSTKVKAASTGTITDVNGSPVGAIVPYQVTTGSEAERGTFNTYRVSMTQDMVSADYKSTYVVPIVVGAPGVINAGISQIAGATSMKAELYIDPTLTTPASTDYWYGAGTTAYTSAISVNAAGTYYVKFSFYSSNIASTITSFAFSAQAYDGSKEKTLSSGAWSCTYCDSYDDVFYYKINVKKTGVITFEEDDVLANNDVQLYKSNKTTEISEKINVYASTVFKDFNKASFAVKKGVYYVKVTGSSGDVVRCRYTFKSVADASGSSKKKAKKISLGKTKKGVLLTSDSTKKYDWYKFTTTKKKKVVVSISGKIASGKAILGVYKSNGKKFGTMDIDRYSPTASGSPYTATVYSTSGTLPKGTYYIKVWKDTKKTSASYSVKVK